MIPADLKLVYAVTVNWNRLEDTCACLDSLLAQEDIPVKIILVDNGSTDGSGEKLVLRYPQVEFLETGKNLGFAGGYNMGIRTALEHGAERVLIVNNDTLAAPDLLHNLCSELDKEGVDATAPVIYYAAAPQKVWSAGGQISPLLLEPSNSHGREKAVPIAPTPRTFLSGCCLLMDRALLNNVGLFDERFFVYYEDLDFCLRILRAKRVMKIVPMAKLWHKVSLSSGGELSVNERYAMARSSGQYFRKHLTWQNAWAVLPYRLVSAILWTLRLATRSKWSALRAYWHGLWQGWMCNDDHLIVGNDLRPSLKK